MLADDKRKQRRFDPIRFAAKPAVAVLSPVKVMRRECDETLLRQVGGEIMVRRDVAFDHVLRDAPAAMLANHDGPPLARLEVFRQQQDSPGEDLRPYVQHYVVSGPLWIVVDAPRPGVGRQ